MIHINQRSGLRRESLQYSKGGARISKYERAGYRRNSHFADQFCQLIDPQPLRSSSRLLFLAF
jgi:hypothetical protein